ncbi:MAG TPA: hypothetical protein VF701_19335 [Thermoanaerobaculia bacterium]
MILYQKTSQLRVRPLTAPEPPFWCASIIAPYSSRRSTPLGIDYLALRASGSPKLEVNVCDRVVDELERSRHLPGPVLIEATSGAEDVFRRGEEALEYCSNQNLPTVLLVSTSGALPSRVHTESRLAIAAWPPDPVRLETLFSQASDRGFRWGVLVPVMFPVTTELETLERIVTAAAAAGASCLGSVTIEGDATARQVIAQSLDLSPTDDRYAMLFHSDLEPIHLSTERHVAALATEHGLADTLLLPDAEARTNWNASALLTLTASRMIAMELDLDLAGLIARSARLVAELDKPLTRIAEAASLGIVGGLDETSVEILHEWLEGTEASFANYVNEQWRLRRA